MLSEKNKKPLLVIVGPTAVGKTNLSINLAERFGGEIISADSRLLYRGMNIGTAKPTQEEKKGIPHYLIDVAEPDEVWSVARYQKEATDYINEIHQKGKLPILVGGTGQYIFSVLQGWTLQPQPINPAMRDILTQWGEEIGAKNLHEKLEKIDPEAACVIQFQNIRRTIRALEVIFSSGYTFSSQKQKIGSPYKQMIIGLIRPRNELYEQIDHRIDEMIRNGLQKETQDLLSKGYSPELSTFSAIGYQEMIEYIQNNITLEEAIIRIKRMTRQFVRRQANWFKPSDPEIHWFPVEERTSEKIYQFVKQKFDMDIHNQGKQE